MNDLNNEGSDPFSELRKRAEAALANMYGPGAEDETINDVRKLFSELQIHQIELEMQNEELRLTQNQLSAEREKYADLYNFAPVAYFTVDQNDVILNLNLAAAELLGHEPHYLINRPITPYLTPESLQTFVIHREKARDSRIPQTCQLTVRRRDGTQAIVQARTALQNKTSPTLWRSIMTDITGQKRIETALRESEERFRSIAEQSTDMIVITDHTGLILYVSTASNTLFGMPPEEMQLHYFHEFLDDASVAQGRAYFDEAILNRRRSINAEMMLRRSDGSMFTGEVNGSYYSFAAQPGTLLMVRDITKRKHTESITELRLEFLEYATSHSMHEFLVKTLDELERVTNSQIAFYHFVEADQRTLSLQAWSTRTLKEYCMVMGEDFHYPLDQAGIWVDCVHQRKPVIHNDYESVKHRKGLPAGHARLTRELVIPVLREDHVVAILGVGNKPTDYVEADVEVMSFLADITWEIIRRKRAEEELRNANDQLFRQLLEIEVLQAELKEQALRDPLTGLYNRRYLAETLQRELVRCKREGTNLSVIIMDIDRFKRVNDQYGHQTGDQFLETIATLLNQHTRGSDFACRYGGEEFLLLMPGTDISAAAKRAEELRVMCSETSIPHGDQNLAITLSLGVATYPAHGSTPDEVLIKADRALYQSKRNGRNRVTVWEDPDGMLEVPES